MKLTRMQRAAALATAALLVLAADPARADQPPIVIGAILSVSGPSALLGEPQANALRLAEKEINAHGGIDGRQVHFDIVDDEGKPDVAAQLATAMVQRNVGAILFGTRLAPAFAAARAVAGSGVLAISLAPTSSVPGARSLNTAHIFEAALRNEVEADFLVSTTRDRFHAKTIALLRDENQFGGIGEQVLVPAAKRLGVTIVADETYDGNATDFTPQLLKIRGAKPDAVILWGTSQAPALATRQARSLGLTAPIVGSSAILTEAFLKITGPVHDVFSDTEMNALHVSGPEQPAFIRAYTAAYNGRPNGFGGFAWDAAGIVRYAYAQAKGKTDGASLSAALESSPAFHGACGTYHFSASDHNGVGIDDVHLVEARNGVWTPLT